MCGPAIDWERFKGAPHLHPTVAAIAFSSPATPKGTPRVQKTDGWMYKTGIKVNVPNNALFYQFYVLFIIFTQRFLP